MDATPVTAAPAKPVNPHRISVKQFMADNGIEREDLTEFLTSCMFDGVAPALCIEGCEVEPDGRCSHNCPSIILALGYI